LSEPSAWLVTVFGNERGYGGNAGYADVLEATYVYDSSVPNCRRVAVGDTFVVRTHTRMEGTASVRRIVVEPVTKQRQRCPVCRTTNVRSRLSQRPKYRCKNRHEFAEPTVDEATVEQFTAHYDGTYRAARGAISMHDLKTLCVAWNQNLAIQALRLDELARRLESTGARSSTVLTDERILMVAETVEPYGRE